MIYRGQELVSEADGNATQAMRRTAGHLPTPPPPSIPAHLRAPAWGILVAEIRSFATLESTLKTLVDIVANVVLRKWQGILRWKSVTHGCQPESRIWVGSLLS
jgi:hypothetical protein